MQLPRRYVVLGSGLIVAAFFFTSSPLGANANHLPADKVAASASTVEIMSVELLEGDASEVHSLLTGTMRTASPTDLIISVTAECALWTDLVVVGNDAPSESQATVKVWVELDGTPVGVAPDEAAGDEFGRVVYCNRAFKMEMTNFDDEDGDHEIDTFLRTRAANGFNWLSMNVGEGVHSLEVLAQLELSVDGQGMAKAAVGKRSLVVEPVKMANDAFIQ